MEKIKSITIPDSVTSIGKNAFSCTGLESITIPDSVTSIGASAFYNCESLKLVTMSDSVTSIEGNTFSNCTSLRSINIPDSVTIIGVAAFSNCTSLKSINIPDSVTIIGGSAFCDCTNLKSITLPDSVTGIGGKALHNCFNLQSVAIMNPDCEIYDSKDTIYIYRGAIYGHSGSTARSYAFKYDNLFVDIDIFSPPHEYGDANEDDEINMSDVVMVMQAYLNPTKYGVKGTSPDRITAEGEKAGDVDGKAGLTANDALIIQRYSLKLIDTL